MTRQEFLAWEQASRDTIDVKRCYIDLADGDLVAGILLSQIIYWHLPTDGGNDKLLIERDGERWLAKERADWWGECRIRPKQFDRASGVLEKLGLIQTNVWRFGGNPTKHIRVCWDVFLRDLTLLSTRVAGGKNDIPQRGISESTKGEEPIHPKVNIEIDQTGKSLTETPSEIPSETTSQTNNNNTQAMPPEAVAVVESLIALGVFKRVALRLVRADAEICKRELALLPHRDARDPAASVVAAIQSALDGAPYSPPSPPKAAAFDERALRAADELRSLPVLDDANLEEARVRFKAFPAEARKQIEKDALAAFRATCPALFALSCDDPSRKRALWTLQTLEVTGYEARTAAAPKPQEAPAPAPEPPAPAPKPDLAAGRKKLKPKTVNTVNTTPLVNEFEAMADKTEWMDKARETYPDLVGKALENVARGLYVAAFRGKAKEMEK